MKITEADYNGLLPVDSYGPGFFRVGGKIYTGPLLVFGSDVAGWRDFDDLDAFEPLRGNVDVLFVGMGAEVAFAPKTFIDAMQALDVMAEPMATPAAARSYNVLLSEGRRVAAALLPMPGTPPEGAR